ncbi:hypothetical protein JCM10212_006739 [Sporobolomyces blumeae]
MHPAGSSLRSPPLSHPSPTLTTSTSKPIRARVDLAALASPPGSPSLGVGPNGSTTTWTPTQAVRVKAKATLGNSVGPGYGTRSAPTTPTVHSSAAFQAAGGGGTKVTPTGRVARGDVHRQQHHLSPQAAGSATPMHGSRAPSPVRARSPELKTARVRTTSTRTAAATSPRPLDEPPRGVLRGQNDPFPSTPTASSLASSSSRPTPITHLPASVSVRKLHSPTLRASQRQERDRERDDPRLSTSTSTTASSASSSVPPLSTSPSSVASSPMTSPNLSHCDSTATLSPPLSHSFPRAKTGLGFYDPMSSCDREAVPASAATAEVGVRRSSGMSSVSSTGRSDCLVSTTNGGLLPPFPSYASSHPDHDVPLPVPFPTSATRPPVRSPTLVSITNPLRSPTLASSSNPLRSPTLPPSSSSRTLKQSAFPSTSTNPLASSTSSRAAATRSPSPTLSTSIARPIQTRSITSSSIGSVGLNPSSPFPSSASSSATLSTTNATLGTSIRPVPSNRARLDALERTGPSRPVSIGPHDGREPDHDGQDDPDDRLGSSPGSGGGDLVKDRIESLLRESIEKEIEAKMSRRIMDLEIRTSSLLTINAQLERHKLKQTSEIRELKRKLRESLGGSGATLRQLARNGDGETSEGGGDGLEYDDEDDEDGDDGEGRRPPTWEELLEADDKFRHIANVVEAMVKRGKKALEATVDDKRDVGGRVISAVEMEDRLEEEEEQEQEGEGGEAWPEEGVESDEGSTCDAERSFD